MLRELCAALLSMDPPHRIAVVDTRMELGTGLTGADILRGYPRALGIETAVRLLNPEILMCDEIYGEQDAEAVLYCASCGVAVAATAHASGYEDLLRRPPMKKLLENGVFSSYIGLIREGNTFRCEVRSCGSN